MKYPRLAAAIQQLVKEFGGVNATGRALKVSSTNICLWGEGNREPAYSKLAIIAKSTRTSPGYLLSDDIETYRERIYGELPNLTEKQCSELHMALLKIKAKNSNS